MVFERDEVVGFFDDELFGDVSLTTRGLGRDCCVRHLARVNPRGNDETLIGFLRHYVARTSEIQP
jgi:hypothetical protein